MEAMVELSHRDPTGTPPATRPTAFDMPVGDWLELFDALAVGTDDAFERLWDVAADRLHAFAVWSTGEPADAADVVAELFARIAERGDELRRIRNPRAWLLTVTRRLCVDVARRRTRRPTDPLEEATFVAVHGTDPDRAVDARRAEAALARLPAPQRQVVFLHLYADCTFAAIGRILGIPTFTAASRYRRAVRRLRQLLEASS
jgi:RNA polymerase sigma-70 factor (ECF subfamily)